MSINTNCLFKKTNNQNNRAIKLRDNLLFTMTTRNFGIKGDHSKILDTKTSRPYMNENVAQNVHDNYGSNNEE
jgi:hypothetical protein